MEDLQRYHAFIRAVELGSLMRAADDLGFSQSSVSRMVAALEAEWDVQLLERSRAGLTLTAAGEALLPYARELVAAQAGFAAAVDAIKGAQTGTVRIGTFSSVATHWLPQVIGTFLDEHPGIAYELLLGDYAQIEAWVAEGRVDLGLTQLPASPRVRTRHLADDELMAVLPKGHPLAELAAVPAEALATERFLLLEKDGNTVVDEAFQTGGARPKPVFTTWDDYAIMAMVEAGLGVSILPSLILRRIPYALEIRPLARPVHRHIGLATRRAAPLSPAAAQFAVLLEATVGGV